MDEAAKVPETSSEGFVDELKPGTSLFHGQYKITRYLNAGGFGITYLATDSLKRQVVVKECFPSSFCRRVEHSVMARSRGHQGELRSIVRLFTREAEALAKLQHPNIVSVHQVFEDNNTAYMAIDFIEGHDLLAITKKKVLILRPDQIVEILKKTLKAIGCVHDAGLLHRDISPDNIIINGDMEPVLIDFGAAREQATKATQALSAMRVVKDGYSPQEFYLAGSEQGPESDLYSLAATFYYVITREIPPDSQKRLSAHVANEPDPYVPLARKTADYDPAFCAAIDHALAILPKDRIKSASDWLAMLDGETPKSRKAEAKQSQPSKKSAGKGNSRKLVFASMATLALAGAGVAALNGGVELPTLASEATPAEGETVASVDRLGLDRTASASETPIIPVRQSIAENATPGPLSEVASELDIRGMRSEWSVPLPFALDDTGYISDPGTERWLDAGYRISEVNGTSTETGRDVLDAARDAARFGDGYVAELRLVVNGPDGATSFGTVTVPVVFETILADGTRISARSNDGALVVSVLEVGSESSLQVGDTLVGLLDSTDWVNPSMSLATLLANEIQSGKTSVRFAVRRSGSMWVERVNLAPHAG